MKSLQCDKCSASFSVEAVQAEVHCPFCRHRQPMAGHEELHSYQRTVEGRLARANEHQLVAASLEAWTSSRASDPKRNLLMAYGLMIGAPLLLAMLLLAADRLGLVPRERGPGLVLGIGAVSYLGLIAYFAWYFTGRKRAQARKAQLAPVTVACPTCGAPGQLTPGTAVDTCAYCSAALIPSRTMMSHGVDAARAAQRQASMARHRAQRAAMAKATNLGLANVLMPIIMVGSFVLMLGGSAVGFSVQMVRGTEPYHPAIFILWAMTLGLVAVVALILSRRRDRRSELRTTLADITKQLGGRVLPTVEERVDWLNRFWISEYEAQSLIQTYVACAAAVEVDGFQALIDVDLHVSKPPPRVDLLMPAWVPQVSDREQPSRRIKHKELSQLGFTVRETEAGLVARGEKKLLDACRKSASATHVVTPALATLAQLAQERGCVPVAEVA